jgi:hypothetical protein
MANDESEDATVVPLPSSETEREHRRVRQSNDRDQRLEGEGKIAPHNVGYDNAAHEPGGAVRTPDNPLDE